MSPMRTLPPQKLEDANRKLAEKQANLAEAKRKLQEVKEKLATLQQQYEEKLATKEELRRKAEETEIKLDRAAKLVYGLAGERIRWEESVKVCMCGIILILKAVYRGLLCSI